MILALLLTATSPFQFFHCVPTAHPDTALVVHYVIDVRSENYSLAVTSGVKSLKAKELTQLTTIDLSLDQTRTQQTDVRWRSTSANLDFQLDFYSNEGLLMRGNLISNGHVILIQCVDVSLEN